MQCILHLVWHILMTGWSRCEASSTWYISSYNTNYIKRTGDIIRVDRVSVSNIQGHENTLSSILTNLIFPAQRDHPVIRMCHNRCNLHCTYILVSLLPVYLWLMKWIVIKLETQLWWSEYYNSSTGCHQTKVGVVSCDSDSCKILKS